MSIILLVLLLFGSFLRNALSAPLVTCPGELNATHCTPSLNGTKSKTDVNCLSEDNVARISSYFINTPGTPRRKLAMERQFRIMRLKPNRVAGSIVSEIFVARHDNFSFKFGKGNMASRPEDAKYIVDFLHGYYDTKIRWGYDNSNTARELSCFISHLLAIFSAVHSDECTRYALIMEDDVFFGYIVNFKALLLTAPKNFGTLQLHTNNPSVVSDHFDEWLKSPLYLWHTRKTHVKWWSAGAYIIDKMKWKRVINKLVRKGPDGKWHFTIIAGNRRACLPSICCSENNTFISQLPCFAAWTGYQADAIIYEYLPTYFFKLPLYNVFPALSLNSSVQTSGHSVRARFTSTVFNTTDSIFHGFYNGTYTLPAAFAKLLPEENMMLRLQNEIYAERSVNVRIRAGLNMTRTNLTSSRSFRRPLGDRRHRLKL